MAAFRNVIKDPTFWVTVVLWILCLVLLVVPFVSKHYTRVLVKDGSSTPPTLPKLGLILVSAAAPLHFVIMTGFLISFLFEDESPQGILMLIISVMGFLIFLAVTILAFFFLDGMPTFELVLLIIYAVTTVTMLVSAVFSYLAIFKEDFRRTGKRESRLKPAERGVWVEIPKR